MWRVVEGEEAQEVPLSKRDATGAGELSRAYGLPSSLAPLTSHGNLQAIVAALCAIPVVGGPAVAQPEGVAAKTVVDASGASIVVEGFIWNVCPLRAPASLPPTVTKNRPATAGRETAQTPATEVRLTQAVIDQVGRAGIEQAQIATRGFTPSTKHSRYVVSIVLGDEDFSLVVGDSNAIWRAHQTAATSDHFELLFARLGDQPGVWESVRILGEAHDV